MSRVRHCVGVENGDSPWWKIKKIISGKINNALSNDSHLYRGGGGNKNITYGHLLYCTQEVLNQIMLLTSYMKW